MTKPLYTCPECGSDRVTLAHIQTFMANTLEHYCHSVKVQDSDAPARCLDCPWSGQRHHLVQADGSRVPQCAGCGATNCDCDAFDCRMGD